MLLSIFSNRYSKLDILYLSVKDENWFDSVYDQPDCFLENLEEKVEVQIRDWSLDESLQI